MRYSTDGVDGRTNVREMSLGKVSVVQMALAQVSQCSWDEPKAPCTAGTLSRILPIGNL